MSLLLTTAVLPRGMVDQNLGDYVQTLRDETELALQQGRYKPFDALVKNFGCQLTALEVMQLVSRRELRPNPGGYSPSPGFIKLMRFRLLNDIHSCKLKGAEEVPVTNIEPLVKKTGLSKMQTNRLVSCLQVEESEVAAKFIRDEASYLQGDRAELIQRLLEDQRVSEKGDKIASVPLVYNTEAALRRVEGIVLVKNKLFLAGQAIVGAEENKVYLRMSQGRQLGFLSADEIGALSPTLPLFVVEGFVYPSVDLKELIDIHGLIKIIRVSGAFCPPYAAYANGTMTDQEAIKDLKESQQEIALEMAFKLDHFYCASVQEERS